MEVLNDKEGGNELLIKAKEATSVKMNMDISANVEDGNNSLQDGCPLVYLSGENDRLG
jgi:hypothetical protein